jgi:hypothetical protein
MFDPRSPWVICIGRSEIFATLAEIRLARVAPSNLEHADRTPSRQPAQVENGKK